MHVDLSTYNNDWYRPGSKLKRFLWYFVNLLFFKNAYNPSSKLKVFWLRVFGAKIGKGVLIKPAVNIKYPWKLTIGNHCWIGEHVWIDNLDHVSIEANVCISQGAFLICGNHNFKSVSFDLVVKPIRLQAGCWIGAKSIVGPGVVVGSHAVLAMGSVASTNLEPYGIYRGNPATKMKQRTISD